MANSRDADSTSKNLDFNEVICRRIGAAIPEPADQIAKAVAKGDFNKALGELDKLREAINKGEFTEQQKQDMAKQLQQMQVLIGLRGNGDGQVPLLAIAPVHPIGELDQAA